MVAKMPVIIFFILFLTVSVVPLVGIEPTRPIGHPILSRARLPLRQRGKWRRAEGTILRAHMSPIGLANQVRTYLIDSPWCPEYPSLVKALGGIAHRVRVQWIRPTLRSTNGQSLLQRGARGIRTLTVQILNLSSPASWTTAPWQRVMESNHRAFILGAVFKATSLPECYPPLCYQYTGLGAPLSTGTETIRR